MNLLVKKHLQYQHKGRYMVIIYSIPYDIKTDHLNDIKIDNSLFCAAHEQNLNSEVTSAINSVSIRIMITLFLLSCKKNNVIYMFIDGMTSFLQNLVKILLLTVSYILNKNASLYITFTNDFLTFALCENYLVQQHHKIIFQNKLFYKGFIHNNLSFYDYEKFV